VFSLAPVAVPWPLWYCCLGCQRAHSLLTDRWTQQCPCFVFACSMPQAAPFAHSLHAGRPHEAGFFRSGSPVVHWTAYTLFKSRFYTHDDNCTWDVWSFGCHEPDYCYLSPQPLELSLCRVREAYRNLDERFPRTDGFDDDRLVWFVGC
jgi:hypothetical protein